MGKKALLYLLIPFLFVLVGMASNPPELTKTPKSTEVVGDQTSSKKQAPIPIVTKVESKKGKKSVTQLVKELKSIREVKGKREYYILLQETMPQSEDEVRQVRGLLDDSDMINRVIGTLALGRMKDKESVPKIIRQIKKGKDEKEDMELVQASLGALGEIGDERAIDILTESSGYFFLEGGYCPIAQIGAPALPRLIELAKKENKSWIKGGAFAPDPNALARASANAIAQIRDSKAIPQLLELARGDDRSIKIPAMSALISMKVKDVDVEVEKLLDGKDKSVKVRSLIYLIRKNEGNDKYLNIALNYMKEKGDEDVFVGELAIFMGQLKEKRAVPYLEKLLKHNNGNVRNFAARALFTITGKVYPYEKNRMFKEREERLYKEVLWNKTKIGRKEALKMAQDEGHLWQYTIEDVERLKRDEKK